METITATKNNALLVQQAIDNFVQGNIPAVIDFCADDIVWSSYENPAVPYAGTYKGKKGVLEFFQTLGGHVDFSLFEYRQFISQGDDVIVLGHEKGTVKKTGKAYDHDWCFHFKMRNGKAERFFAFVDSADQVQAFS